MNYYPCSTEEIRLELQRRGLTADGPHDELSEMLEKDDKDRGADATTVNTFDLDPHTRRNLDLTSHAAEFGRIAPIDLLVNEKIVHWTMNTFFPSIQLFFESGLSCTIGAGRHSDAIIHLDPALRFRLTDCSHEENGRLVKALRPTKFARSDIGIAIREATVARRASIVIEPRASPVNATVAHRGGATIGQEGHTVVGLRLEGMSGMAYVYARAGDVSLGQHRLWVDVRPTALRDDVPPPSLASSFLAGQSGSVTPIVLKESQIRDVKDTKLDI